MANITINSTPTRVQYTASSGQTTFTYSFPIKEDSDLKVYKRSSGSDPDDANDLLTLTTNYTVTGANTANGGTVVLTSGATTGDIITIVGDKPIDRTAIYDQSSTLKKADLNNDFNDNVMYDKQINTLSEQLSPSYNRSEEIYRDRDNPGNNVRAGNLTLPILNDGFIWIGRGDKGDSPDDIDAQAIGDFDSLGLLSADYVVGTAQTGLTNEQVLGDLSSGVMVNSVSGSTGTVITRTLTGTSNEITIADGTGVSGNPTFGIADNPVLPGTEGFVPPSGTTAERPGSPTLGEIRFNTTTNEWEAWDGTNWVSFGTGSGAGSSEWVQQNGHTFTGGEAVRRDGGTNTFVAAQANSSSNAEQHWIVVDTDTIGGNDFILIQQTGLIDDTSSFAWSGEVSDGTVLFLSESNAGELTATEPSTGGEVSKPVFSCTGANKGWILPFRGMVIDGAGGGGSTGNWVKLAEKTLSGSSVDFDNVFDSTYKLYRVEIFNLSGTSTTEVCYRFGTGSGPTYQTSNYVQSGSFSTNDGIRIADNSTRLNSSSTLSGNIVIYDPSDSTNVTRSMFTSLYFQTAEFRIDGYGKWGTTTAVTSIQLYVVSGTLDGGTAIIYGQEF